MKILLINSNRHDRPFPVIPFGLCRVAAAVEAAGHTVSLLDLCFVKRPPRTIRRSVRRFAPDAVGITVRNIDNGSGFEPTFLLDDVRRQVVRPLLACFQGPVVVGGPAVGINTLELLNYLGLEYAIRGDGELAMPELLRRLERGQTPQGCEGLMVVRQGRTVCDPVPAVAQRLDDLPLSRPQRYVDLAAYRRYGSPLQVQTKRGCALRCTYCTYRSLEGPSYRLRSPTSVADEIELLAAETAINRFEFTDSTFNIPLDHAKAVLRELCRRPTKLRLSAMGLNPSAVDAELVDLMKRAGFVEVDLGAEAACDVTLRSLGKNFNKFKLLDTAKLLREAEIPTVWFLLLGAPAETEQTLRETLDTVAAHASPWDLINIGVGVRVYRGAPVADQLDAATRERAERDGYFRPVGLEPAGISLAEVKRICAEAVDRHPNIMMYSEDADMPLGVFRAMVRLARLVAPNQPLWRGYIAARRLRERLGKK